MKPFLNIDELDDFETHERDGFAERCASIGDKIGSVKLGYSISIVPPGKKVCPFHNHRINEEMFLVLEGEGTLRFGDKEYAIRKHDIIACPPGGRDVAHQIINTSNSDIRYLCLSTNEPHDICEYPDSNKMLAMTGKPGNRDFSHICDMSQQADYFDGES
ncbi:MAG: cupin domain-containing protein [Gammaproteobacteria bacterium]|nr:cupin domain-containing protein [Gammaproteobacteria bacterium]